MVKSAYISAIFVLTGITSVSAVEPLSNNGILLDRVVAVVNEGILLQSQLNERTQLVTQQIRSQNGQMPPRDVLAGQVLEQLIVQEVQLQRARRLGIRVSDGILNSRLNQVAQRNGLSLSDLPAAMASQGINYNLFREDMRQEMMLDSLHQRDVLAKITVSEKEIQRYLEREESNAGVQIDYELSQILASIPVSSRQEDIDAAQATIDQLYEQLVDGAEFSELARSRSDGQNALNGGDLGWRKGAQLPPAFFDVVRDLEPGQFTSPVRSPSGFHILKVNDIRGAEQIIVLQTHLRHILMQPDQIMDDKAIQQKLTQIRERILDGDDFADVARLESADPGSATQGGDLGWSSVGSFPPDFEAMVEQLSPGEISEPFRTDFGWHIVLLEDRKERDTTDEVKRERAVAAIRESKQEQETEIWLRQLRDEAYVETRS
ncbi:MAG: peptidylprolyl isomerase [Gammaproteobacteria bacterium]